ncbi:YheC/YheD family protein [Oceanobacillus timonensis]|uniref:YheC/YheD family protein n=1 Tax=Oceanobacillus timonensis TaxID=1926285 RepID=UPI0009BC0114|nr:YheC/YheD family protein [Oceanobacillus timonensis]
MYICFMRNFTKPPEYVKLLAKAAKYYDIELIYSHPKNVDINKEVINGLTLHNNVWRDIEISVPAYIDLNSYSYKYKNVIAFLKKKSTLLNPKGFGSKLKIYNTLIEDGEFAKYIPDTIQINGFDDVMKFIQKYDKAILKPRVGHKGIGVYLINKINETSYQLYFKNSEKTLSAEELRTYIEDLISDKVYLAQQYIQSVTTAGDPFDCRIRLEKNVEAKWAVAIHLIRIGSNNKVVSNVAQGGGVQKLVPFIKFHYPDKWENIKIEFDYLAEYLPPKLEALYHKQTSCLGIDIGIDRDGKIYIYEVNAAPGMEFGEAEIINLKVDYYHYLQQTTSE